MPLHNTLPSRVFCAATALALLAGCGSGTDEAPAPITTTTTQADKPLADPPEKFAAKGVPIGPPNAVVGYQAAFAYEMNGADASVVATDLATGKEVWRWKANAEKAKQTTRDTSATYLALSRVEDRELLQFTGIADEKSLRTTVLDAKTGDVVRTGELVPADEVGAGGGSNADVKSLGVSGDFAVSTIGTTTAAPLTMITDLRTGKAEWAPEGFFAAGIVETDAGPAAVGMVAESLFADGPLQAIALDTRQPVWTGGTVRSGTVQAPAPTLATADIGDVGTNATHLFDPKTGKEIGVLDDPATCLWDAQDVVVCTNNDKTTALDATTGKALWDKATANLNSAFHGRVYIADTVVDARTGDEITTNLKIIVDAAVPGYAVMRDRQEARAYPATG